VAREIIASRFQAACGSKRAISRSVAPDLVLSPPEWRYRPPAVPAKPDRRQAGEHRPVSGQEQGGTGRRFFLALLFPTLLEIFSIYLNIL
jgi:hypothetical protein